MEIKYRVVRGGSWNNYALLRSGGRFYNPPGSRIISIGFRLVREKEIKMKIPEKIRSKILEEALKYARFTWYQGWQRSSGYIKAELSGENRYSTCRLYIPWEKKKPPTDKQIKEQIEKKIDSYLENEEHHSSQRDFTHYLLSNYYIDLSRVKHEVSLTLDDSLRLLISILEKSDDFVDPKIQELHNVLKNYECAIGDHEAVKEFLEKGRKRIGER